LRNSILDYVCVKARARKVPSSYVISELQGRLSELSVKMASLETELNRYKIDRKTSVGARYTFLKVLCSILLFVSGLFLVLYCHIMLHLSMESFLTLGALVFSILSFIVVKVWKI